jgi:hypothetical protein
MVRLAGFRPGALDGRPGHPPAGPEVAQRAGHGRDTHHDARLL